MRYLRGHNNARDAPPAPIRRTPPPADAAGYAEQLLHALSLFVGAVHDEGPAERRAALSAALRLTPPSGVDPVEALAVVLAAQIDPDLTGEQRLGWTRRFAGPDGSPRRMPPPRKEPAA
jgi:hypothetical protein